MYVCMYRMSVNMYLRILLVPCLWLRLHKSINKSLILKIFVNKKNYTQTVNYTKSKLHKHKQ